jgi:hypothetical protein
MALVATSHPVMLAATCHHSTWGATAMTMAPNLRKFVLTVHITSSLGFLGAALAYLGLGISAVTSEDAQTVRAAWIAMEVIGWYVIVPLALAALLTGLVQALGTPWGLFRHYWVLITFLLTIFATVILLLHMPSVSALAEVAREQTVLLLTGWEATSSTPGRPAGIARDHGAERVQAAGLDPVRVAEAARAACGVAAIGAAFAWGHRKKPCVVAAIQP